LAIHVYMPALLLNFDLSAKKIYPCAQTQFRITIPLGRTTVKRIIIGISGASGVIYGIRLLEVLAQYPDLETHLVLTDIARDIIRDETHWHPEQVEALAHTAHGVHDLSAPISSGSFLTEGMIVAPCSIKSMSWIAASFTENLLVRAADATLKEGRKLVLLVRETPLHLGHLRSLVRLAEMGAVILPPIPAFYHHPTRLDDIISHTLGKVLDQFHIPHTLFNRWQGPQGKAKGQRQKAKGK
jgi:4-hydroxy-3-polyprenylbenzoate decarboxylase